MNGSQLLVAEMRFESSDAKFDDSKVRGTMPHCTTPTQSPSILLLFSKFFVEFENTRVVEFENTNLK
ncbi:hypothetical protein RHMOL_Rhmol12G0238200 [Rhododendron molle]|uniref:Uncharacterized protein n=1 Tax=Rhododendron molle TaxID=49168 RepID=A0ACC0LLV2_RHOML|nr:hypothetical protein RHMOL_Rhmol12G0238200 [Rhododendron molle]